MSIKNSALWALVKKNKINKALVACSVLFTLLGSASAILFPLITKQVIDQISSEHFPWKNAILLCVIMVGGGVIVGLNSFVLGRIGQDFLLQIRIRVHKHLLRLPVYEFEKGRAAEPVSRIIYDAKEISGFVSQQFVGFIGGFINLVASFIILWFLDSVLTAVVIASIVVTVLIVIPISSRLAPLGKNIHFQEAHIIGRLAEVFNQLRLVKTSGAENEEEIVAQKQIKDLHNENLKEITIHSIMTPIILTSFTIILAGIFIVGTTRVASEAITLGSLVAYMLYLVTITVPVQQLSSFSAALSRAMGAAYRLSEFEHIETEKYEGVTLDKFNQGINIKNLAFAYPGQEKNALSIDSLVIPHNSITALVGRSGSGKSTLFTLMNRLFESKGIYYGQTPIENIDLIQWRSLFANVAQDSPMLAGTIEFNLTYGLNCKSTKEECITALENAQLWEFLQTKEGLDTIIGEKGINLSGGQRQRLAIARAILRKPEILLLDEATSSLDSKTEKAVTTALKPMMSGRTTIVAAHRLNTIRDADQIVMLHDGKVLAVGTHDVLLKTCSDYEKLVEEQMKVHEADMLRLTNENLSEEVFA